MFFDCICAYFVDAELCTLTIRKHALNILIRYASYCNGSVCVLCWLKKPIANVSIYLQCVRFVVISGCHSLHFNPTAPFNV